MADRPAFLFRDVSKLPCPTLASDFPADDACLLSIDSASIYWGVPVPDLERFWVETFFPTLGLSTPSAATTTENDGTDAAQPSYDRLRAYRVLRSAGYQQLTDPELDALLEFCRPRKLNPLARHVYPTWKRDGDGVQIIEFRLSIDGMWEIARRGGGFDGNRTKHERGPDGRPIWTEVCIWRIVDGRRVKYRAVVEYEGRYPGRGVNEMWDRDPWRMLEKNAEVAALRKAFPELLGGVYEIDEPGFRPTRDSDPLQRRLSRGDLAMDPHRKEPWPDSLRQFELALCDCSLGHEQRRRAVIQALHAELPGMSGPAFYRDALRLIYADPSRWGAKLPVAE